MYQQRLSIGPNADAIATTMSQMSHFSFADDNNEDNR